MPMAVIGLPYHSMEPMGQWADQRQIHTRNWMDRQTAKHAKGHQAQAYEAAQQWTTLFGMNGTASHWANGRRPHRTAVFNVLQF